MQNAFIALTVDERHLAREQRRSSTNIFGRFCEKPMTKAVHTTAIKCCCIAAVLQLVYCLIL